MIDRKAFNVLIALRENQIDVSVQNRFVCSVDYEGKLECLLSYLNRFHYQMQTERTLYLNRSVDLLHILAKDVFAVNDHVTEQIIIFKNDCDDPFLKRLTEILHTHIVNAHDSYTLAI